MKYLSLLSLIVFTACSSAKKMNTNKDEFPAFSTEAHRGGRGLMPENTIPAMLDAIDRGVTTLELDVHITKDKQVVLSHDPYFNADITTTPEGKTLTKAEGVKRILYDMTYDSIRRYDVGLKEHPGFPQQKKMAAQKPLLRDVFREAEKHAKAMGKPAPFYNIETKSKKNTDGIRHPAPEEFVDLLVAVVKNAGVVNRTVIQSFDMRTLQVLHKKYPAFKTSLLIDKNVKTSLDEQLQELGFTPFIYSPHYSLVTPELLQQCHQKGIKVIPWTVNEKEEIIRLKQMGVDGIITDYPNLF